MIGLTVSQLQLMRNSYVFPDRSCDQRVRGRFVEEEAFLHYIIYNRLGITKLQIPLYYFEGDHRLLIYSTRYISTSLYETFYHKILGDSMKPW